MRGCEHYETLLSTWQDGELDHSEQMEMLDHLIGCSGCREFYLDVRGLAGVVASVRTSAAAEAPSPDVWRRIERSTRFESSSRPSFGGSWKRWFPTPAWGVTAAAAVFLLVFSSTVGKRMSPLQPQTSLTEIQLGANPDGMDDARFVELTKRVLGADKKYRTAFYEIMKQVVEDTQGNEPPSDLLLRQQDRREGAEVPERAGGPS
jgi:hypothetical protein